MERYFRWERLDGLPFDPWFRVHRRLGAEFVRVASQSMVIMGTILEWEEWTGMHFPEDAYVVPGALQPVVMDLERNLGTYEEPNVWMRHPYWRGDYAEGEKVTLRAIEREDQERLWRFWNDLEVELAGGGDPPLPVSSQRLRERFDSEAREGLRTRRTSPSRPTVSASGSADSSTSTWLPPL